MKKRPWIWFIIANVVFIAGLTTLVVIAVRHAPKEIPLTHGR
jgi:hypothetical protein